MPDAAPFSVLWRVVLHQQLDNIAIQNVFHFTNKQEIPTGALRQYTEGLLDDWNTRIKSNWQACQVNALLYIKITNTTMIPIFGPVHEVIYPVGEVGAQEGNAIPTFCAAVISKATGFSGRKNRGRFYLAGLTEAAVFENETADFQHTHLVNLSLALLANWGEFGSDQRNEIVLYSHKDGDTPLGPSYLGVKKIVNFIPRRTVYTQRHRLMGHGP